MCAIFSANQEQKMMRHLINYGVAPTFSSYDKKMQKVLHKDSSAKAKIASFAKSEINFSKRNEKNYLVDHALWL
jgi:hypothetical protein